MKICIFTHQYLPSIGGVQVLVHNFIQYLLKETPHEILLVAPYYGGQSHSVETIGRLKIYRIFNPNKRWSVFKALWKFPSILKKEVPDLIHGQDLLIDAMFCSIAHLCGSWPVILSTQGELNPFKRNKIPWQTLIKVPYLKWVMSKTFVVIAPEPNIKKKLAQYIGYPSKIHQINNAIYVSSEQQCATKKDYCRLSSLGIEPEHYFLFLGRLILEKGVVEIVEAVTLQQAHFRQNNFKFYFSGDGSAKSKLQELCSENHINDLILFSKDILPQDKWILLRHCRAMVLPSWEENLPISMLEAFGLNIPVIGSDIPEIKALITSPSLGNVIKLKSVESLSLAFEDAMKTQKILAPDVFAKAMAPYDLRQMGTQFLKLYDLATFEKFK